MEEKEIHKILQYKRPHDIWLCPECDAENSLSVGKCIVCRSGKPSNLIILKAWTEADDRPVTLPPKKTTTTKTTTTTSGSVFKDDRTETPSEPENNKNKIIWGVIIAIIIIVVMIIASQSENTFAYLNAMNEFKSGNYKTAITLFEKLPSDYKDVSIMINESKYKEAIQLYNNKDFTSAEALFKSIPNYKDSASKVNECQYQIACNLLETKKYTEAKKKFQKISTYSDSSDKILECDYRIADKLFDEGKYAEAKSKFQNISNYSNSDDMILECSYMMAVDFAGKKEYVSAMELFNELGSYKDSRSRFDAAENDLIQMNKTNGYFTDDYSMIGYWRSPYGDYVKYEKTANGTHTWYNLFHTKGEHYKLSYGIHYHGSDSSGWKKQWIYQRIDSKTVNAYDYINGQAYELIKQ